MEERPRSRHRTYNAKERNPNSLPAVLIYSWSWWVMSGATTCWQEGRVGEAVEALNTGARQHWCATENPSWGGTSWVAITVEYLNASHRQHQCAGEDPTLGRAADVQGTAEALPTRHLQPWSTREELTREGAEEVLRKGGRQSSIGGCSQTGSQAG